MTCITGFDKAHYKQTLNEIFGANSEYEFDLGRPLERSDYPVNAAWRNGSIKGFLAACKEGKEKTGVDDNQVCKNVEIFTVWFISCFSLYDLCQN